MNARRASALLGTKGNMLEIPICFMLCDWAIHLYNNIALPIFSESTVVYQWHNIDTCTTAGSNVKISAKMWKYQRLYKHVRIWYWLKKKTGAQRKIYIGFNSCVAHTNILLVWSSDAACLIMKWNKINSILNHDAAQEGYSGQHGLMRWICFESCPRCKTHRLTYWHAVICIMTVLRQSPACLTW